MELLVCNLSGKPRKETLLGREYLVTPATLIIPKVLNGNRGRGYYPLDEIEAGAGAWNIMPIVRNHPVVNGQAVTARNPIILQERGMGFVFNSKVDGKLTAETWFDVENTKRVDPNIYSAVERGDRIELSTGLDVSFDMTKGVTNAGEEYDWVARSHKPDHLAVITNGKGACSIDHGCGVNNSETEKEPGWVAGLMEKLSGLLPNKQTLVTNQEPNVEKLNDTQRKGHVDNLITNCSCTYKEADRDALSKLEDRVLVSLSEGVTNAAKLKTAEEKAVKDAAILKAAQEGFQVGNDKMTLNEKGEWIKKEEKKEAPVINTEKQPIKMEDLPAEMRASVEFGQRAEKQAKGQLIDRLVANVADDKKAARRETLAKLTLNELEDRILDLPPVKEGQQANGQQSYFGQQIGNAPVINAADKPKPIPQTRYDWAGMSKNLSTAGK